MTPKSKIYTRTGDKGETSLFGGKRVSKTHQRIAAIGSVDELNAALGLVQSLIKSKPLKSALETIQVHLFNIGAELANPGSSAETKAANISFLEQQIDKLDSKLVELRNFILPGGSLPSSQAQLARSIARRAEREVLKLNLQETVSTEILSYLNRLADFLFVFARYQNRLSGNKEKIWKKK